MTYPLAFPCLERLTLAITGASAPKGDLHKSFFDLRSTLNLVDSATLKHVAMRLDYGRTPQWGDLKVLSECRELEQLLLGRKLETVVIAVVNARRNRGNLQSIVRNYEKLFPALFQRGILGIILGM